MRRAALAWLMLLCAGPAPRAQDRIGTCDPAAIERDVRTLASDSYQGRGLGTVGLDHAILAVAQRFAALGLEPAFPQGEPHGLVSPAHPLAGYLQGFQPQGLPVTANVVGLLPGDAPRAPQAVVVGAHIDHLGYDTALEGDPIYNGADDNASGVAAMLEIARLLAAEPARAGDRTVVFIAFSAEESGLLGSQYYCAHPVVPHEETIAMLNLDSVGRLTDDRLYVFGARSARELPDILEALNLPHGFDLVLTPGDLGELSGSDHASFASRGVPALFLCTGPHEDYSRVTDEADRIAFDGLARVTELAAECVRYLRYRGRGLTFVAPASATAPAASPARERKVSLGFMPDFGGEGGVKVGRLSPGGAAERAGMQAGDLIVALGGVPVASLAEYTDRLRALAPGDRIAVTIQRAGLSLDLQATVQERH